MPSPSPALQTLLTQFANEPGVTPDAAANLQSVVNGSPVLINQLNAAIMAGHLQKFVLLPASVSAGGTYDGNNKVMNLPLASLSSDANGSFSPIKIADLTFVVGHEVQHGFNHQAKNQAYIDFNTESKQIAQNPALQHDYTAPISTLINANRNDESKAEIAGWNALVSNIQKTNPNPSLQDIYIANPGRMRDFIDMQSAGTPGNIAYTLKSGFTLNPDRSMAETPANVAAIGQSYFDKAPQLSRLGHNANSDYSNYYGAYAVGRASVLETSFAQLSSQNIMPTMMINMTQLRFSEQLLEENGVNLGSGANQTSTRAYYDTSQTPASLHHFNHSAVTHTYVPVLMQEPAGIKNGRQMQTEEPKHPSYPNQEQRTDAPATPPLGPPRAELDPRDRNHPDHALYQQALAGVHQHDTKLGRIPDEKSEQMAASLTALAKQNGMNRIDHVVFSVDNGRGIKAGENVFIVQGEMGNPAADRAHMKTDVAVNASMQSSFQQLESINQKQAQEVLTQQQSQQQRQQAQVQQQSGGAAMRAVG